MTVFFSEAELEQFRADAESRMLSRATVRRKTGATTIDANGFEVAGLVVPVHEHPLPHRWHGSQPVAVAVTERWRC
jgi:hypothetical protein